MNTWRLAYTNIKKSVSDYVVYFITLILGVAIFYVFNAIGDQALIEDLSNSGYESIQLMISLLTGASIGVALILGFLIVYANNFLIRRRKKEFGIYLLLGMGKRQVSRILYCETVIAGLISLGVGLGLGVLGSQLLSILVGNFFEADMSAYHFSFSAQALLKTVISFAVMNLVVLIFHAATITKYQLVDLLTAEKKAEENVVGKSYLAVILFVLAATALGYAYYRVGFRAMEIRMREFFFLIILGAVANMVLFWSLSGFLMTVVQKWKGVYFKNLNSFVTRQFCAGINSSSITMGIICLMLLVTIITFSTGFSMANEFQGAVRKKTPVDFSISRDDGVKVSDWFAQEGMPLSDWAKEDTLEIPIYGSQSLTFTDTVGSGVNALREQFPMAIFWDLPADVMSVSDFNRLMKVYGCDEVALESGTYLLTCDFSVIHNAMSQAMREGQIISLAGSELVPASEECLDDYIMMSGFSLEFGTTIVPDEVIQNGLETGEIAPIKYHVAGNYKETGKQKRLELDNRLNYLVTGGDLAEYAATIADRHLMVGTKIAIRESNNGLTMMVTFLVVYVGTVFLIASAAILSLKALSESIDSQKRYAILKKLGCSKKMLRKALLAQIGVFFLLPLFVATIHSFFGLRLAETELKAFLAVGTGYGVVVTLVVMVTLYGGYMLASIRASEKIVGVE